MSMYKQYKPGWIEVITGCMFAGKTEELISRIKTLQYAKQQILVFKPSIDNRYSFDEIASHSGYRVKSINTNCAKDILKYIKEDTQVVVVDECQFYDRDIIYVCERLANKGIRVICAGLDRDFRGEPFGVMPELLVRAEFVSKLSAVCVKCGAPATRTQRLINGVPANYNDAIIMVGASESYEARCRHCHEVPGSPETK